MKIQTNFYKNVFSLVIPLALQNLINVGVTTADVVMLGKVGETSLSASSLAGQVQFIMTLILFGLTSGAAVLTSQYWGKKDIDAIEKVMGITLRIGIMVALVFSFAAILIPEKLMRVYTADQVLIKEGIKYLRIISIAYTLNAITMIYLNIMRSIEKVIISTVVYSISLLVNIILNAIFIFGLFGFTAMGIEGAALATLIARAVELCIVIGYEIKGKHEVHLRFSHIFKMDKTLFRDFLILSFPVLLNELMWGAGSSANTAVMGHMGSAAVAANSVAQVTRQLATVISFGIASAAAIMLGKTIGEEKYEEAKIYSKRFVKLSILFGGFGATLIILIRPFIISSLSLTDAAKSYLGFMLLVMAYFTLCQAYNTTMVVGIFRSGGDTRFGLILDILSMWGGSILLGALAAFVFKFSVPIVYILLMSDEILKLPFTTIRFRSYKWLKNITR
ncbi:MATE family efflux transporter [Candidatus Galacturonibacter soehngenii]|uniref:MATE family efflux transporter n=1 Tax=Candidatus Galacturonatibacter soehngenii TaxID=2307010 RepID=A0A7V7UHR8_9FIRM|nr:MATE family efflux transporter [Candidatus Galacturonibacter soehngenii]KAB1440408.1 MATE family efflux transporter [Candidatus Galacturonibacter soehngenii]MBA4688930.1 MATE family efflux transporter [Candidatus Galacturonibacter soehngenii]